MLDFQSVRTYRDLFVALQNASDEQLDMPIQCADSHPVDEHVHKLKQAICLGTVDTLELRYARSVKDNRRNGDELVLFCDGNPFGEDGASGHTLKSKSDSNEPENPTILLERFEPIYPDDHDETRDWTGPAQKHYDQEKRESGRGTLAEILSYRANRPRPE